MNGGVIGRRNVPGVDGFSGAWSLREIADAQRAGVWVDYAIAVMSDSPVSYWRLDETAGTIAADSVGGNDGTYTGGYTLNQAGIPAVNRPAVLLNGSSGYIDLGTPATLNITAAWSLEAWVYLTSTPDRTGIIGEIFTGSGDNVLYELGFGINSGTANSNPTVGYYTGSAWKAVAGSPLSLNAWHHLVGTWDGAKLSLFIDKDLAASAAQSPGPTAGVDGFYIGRLHGVSGGLEYFPGRIDEVAVYDHALSPDRVAAHYNAGVGSTA